MTQLREQAIEMIKEIPEDKIIYVVNILKNMRILLDTNVLLDYLMKKDI